MERPNRSIDRSGFVFHFLFIVLFPGLRASQEKEYCKPSQCDNRGPSVRYPFRLKGLQPHQHCGYPTPGFELSCDKNDQTVLKLPISVKLLIKKIDYKAQLIEVYDPLGCFPKQLSNLNLSASIFRYFSEFRLLNFTLFNCSGPVRDSRYDVRLFPCLGVPGYNVYAIQSNSDISYYPVTYYPLTSCTKIHNVGPVPWEIYVQKSSIQLRWLEPNCSYCEANGKFCSSSKNHNFGLGTECVDKPKTTKGTSKKVFIAGLAVGLFLLLLAVISLYYVYSSNKMAKENQVKIEKFLDDYKALKPTRYSYADIKNITNQFSDKLGEGGYGTVYKGKLSDEIFVAVKVLNDSMGYGEEFINEVGTIGRIHHVNVVRLVGFCADGFRRALVYEFLPNDSLEKFIFLARSKTPALGWKKLQDIALGIAKGIEYLHQGCDQRILHFDIKPHNILLDHNLHPKISDFGLAKLCSKGQSAVSITAARGTMGYIAPEVLSRNFGKVSFKSDVYSFGMLLLEMVGGRKNNSVAMNISQAYFPEWIYNRLNEGEELEIRIEEDGDVKIVRKLTIVGLWCVQWHAVDRPSMKVVVQMLEGEEDKLIVPPNPFAPARTRTLGTPLQQELAVISELE